MIFYSTNRQDDPGIDIPTPELVARFWADPLVQAAWGHGIVLERLLRGFLAEHVGGWDADAATLAQFDILLDACLRAAPPMNDAH